MKICKRMVAFLLGLVIAVTSCNISVFASEAKKEVFETYEICRRSGDCRADELRHIVNYYFEKYNAQPAGWFDYFNY